MNSIIPRQGGKSRLAGTIIPLIPEHECYVEPFCGAANVLFRKLPVKAEVLNDIDGELINLYRVIQHHLDEFIRHFRWALVSRDEFSRQLTVDPATLTDIQRAARYYYLAKTSFGGKMASPTYGTATTGRPRLNLLRIEEDLSAAHLRLAWVNVERLPYHKVITKYDRPHTFFYLDPPYHGCENDYGKGIFSEEDFTSLRDQLAGIKGAFMMSINDTPLIRELFGRFHVMEVSTTYSLNVSGSKKVQELLVMNFTPKDVPLDKRRSKKV